MEILAASVEAKLRKDGGTSYIVRWRQGGTRAGKPQNETFGVGPDAANAAHADGFKRMVEAAGNYWPEGWVKDAGFVRDRAVEPGSPVAPSRLLREVGMEYVEQILACSPGSGNGIRPRCGTEDDVKAWLIGWDRSMKTKANYHGLLTGIFTYALERDLVPAIPTRRTAPKKRQIVQSQADLRFLTEREFAIVARAAGDDGDMLRVTAGTGLRYGEVTSLWASDIDPRHQTIRVNKARKRDGEDGAQDIPSWIRKALRPKHAMSGHYLGNPKTLKSSRRSTPA